MSGVRPVLEAVDGESQARRGFGQIRGINLFNVAQADDLGARSGAGDQGFHLLGRDFWASSIIR